MSDEYSEPCGKGKVVAQSEGKFLVAYRFYRARYTRRGVCA